MNPKADGIAKPPAPRRTPAFRMNCVLFFALAMLAPAIPLQAHRLAVNWQVQGQTLVLEGRTDGGPAASADVELRSPSGSVLATGNLDADGRFRWPLAGATQDVVVVVNAGPGHRRTLTLAAADLLAAGKPASTRTATVAVVGSPVTDAPPAEPRGAADGAEPLATRVVLGLTFLLAAAAAWMSHRNGRRLAALERRWHEHESRG
jgi:hypothetical protein